jgi:uridine kinase/Gpi18-like mannosyltransferase
MKLRKILYDRNGLIKIDGLKHPLFWAGLVLKVICSVLFASNYLTHLFAPFVNYFVSQGSDPYVYFIRHNQSNAFPYPALMLYILAVPRWLLSPFFSGDFNRISYLDIFTIRLSVLAADFTILCVLLRWLKGNYRKVLLFYWFSPVLIYINYIHGQLDAIPIALLFCSIYFLFKDRFFWASLFMALAVSAKTNILIVLPFYVIYAWRARYFPKRVFIAGLAAIPVIFVIINAPFIFSSEFIQMVFQNSEQGKVYNAFYDLGGSIKFYFIPAAYFGLIIQFLNFKAYDRNIFLIFLGFSFGILTLFIPPMQGWYYWIMPFFVFFFIRQIGDKQHGFSIAFLALSGFYFLYFLLVPQSDYLEVFQVISPRIAAMPNLFNYFAAQGTDLTQAGNIAFSLLQDSLFVSCIWIYLLGIRSNFNLKIQYQPLLIGIGGDSGSGKTTFTNLLQKVFHKKNISIVRGDDMHKWERGDKNWEVFTHLNPKANFLHEDMMHTAALKRGQRIDRRIYDHNEGKFTLPKQVDSNKIIIFEGLHPFYLSSQAKIFDLKIFIHTEDNLKLHWKAVRDIKKRGYTQEQVLKQIQDREADSLTFIKSQEDKADIVLSYLLKKELAEPGNEAESADICVKLRFDNNIDVNPLIGAIENKNALSIEHTYFENNQEVEFYGNISAELISNLADEFIPDLWDLGFIQPKWEEGYKGIIQLFTTYHIFYKMKIDKL